MAHKLLNGWCSDGSFKSEIYLRVESVRLKFALPSPIALLASADVSSSVVPMVLDATATVLWWARPCCAWRFGEKAGREDDFSHRTISSPE